MKPRIDMVEIMTQKLREMTTFYQDTLHFPIIFQTDQYVEFKNDGVRFSLSTPEVMHTATGKATYLNQPTGHQFGFAFRADSAKDVDTEYQKLLDAGVTGVTAPADMPWNQRTAFFADPDGNIHEIFADL